MRLLEGGRTSAIIFVKVRDSTVGRQPCEACRGVEALSAGGSSHLLISPGPPIQLGTGNWSKHSVKGVLQLNIF